MAIHNRLSTDSVDQWKRKDVLGFLMAAYGMLLRSSPIAMTSPRVTGGSPGGSNVIKRTSRECLEAPAELKSFTFARLCMVPALRQPSAPRDDEYFNLNKAPMLCDNNEFQHSVLADFGSHYLEVLSTSGESPISRLKWKEDAEESLRLQRTNQEQMRSFRGDFASRGLFDSETVEAVPAMVNLLERPDCMDDVIAFATAVCSLGPEYAFAFWSQEEHRSGPEDGEAHECLKLVPSRALKDFEAQQRKDESLRPLYLSFLAALALAKNPFGGEDGAAVIHSMFSHGSDQHSWSELIGILRWYVRELDPQPYTTRSASTSASSQGTTSTAYYYSDQGGISDVESKKASGGDTSITRTPNELGPQNTVCFSKATSFSKYTRFSRLLVLLSAPAHSSVPSCHHIQRCCTLSCGSKGNPQHEYSGHEFGWICGRSGLRNDGAFHPCLKSAHAGSAWSCLWDSFTTSVS